MIFKARAKCLDIKIHKKWKYKDDVCIGCGKNSETEEEFLSCKGYKTLSDTPIELVLQK